MCVYVFVCVCVCVHVFVCVCVFTYYLKDNEAQYLCQKGSRVVLLQQQEMVSLS